MCVFLFFYVYKWYIFCCQNSEVIIAILQSENLICFLDNWKHYLVINCGLLSCSPANKITIAFWLLNNSYQQLIFTHLMLFVSAVDLFRLVSLPLTLADKSDGSNRFYIQMFCLESTLHPIFQWHILLLAKKHMSKQLSNNFWSLKSEELCLCCWLMEI